MTKELIQRGDLPILPAMNYSTLLDDPDRTESLDFPFDILKHGATVDMEPKNLYGDGVYMSMKNIFSFGGIMKRSTII